MQSQKFFIKKPLLILQNMGHIFLRYQIPIGISYDGNSWKDAGKRNKNIEYLFIHIKRNNFPVLQTSHTAFVLKSCR